MSVTRLGVSVENVVATIETPNNHQGILLPDKKYSLEFLPDDFDTTPMVVVDDNDNFRMYCIAGKVESQLKQLSSYTNVKGWRALTHEEFEKLNQGL